jgi:hypothetical protein
LTGSKLAFILRLDGLLDWRKKFPEDRKSWRYVLPDVLTLNWNIVGVFAKEFDIMFTQKQNDKLPESFTFTGYVAEFVPPDVVFIILRAWASFPGVYVHPVNVLGITDETESTFEPLKDHRYVGWTRFAP